MKEITDTTTITVQIGTLYGISVGPGDPELITLKGLKAIASVPVVAFPAGLRGNPGIAEQILAQWMSPHQVQLALEFPYVQDEAVLTQAWNQAADRVWQYLQDGKDVAFASEGDVSFYSTFTYLAQTLQRQHPEVVVQVVPGVCSPLAAVAELGIPLTIRDRRLAVLPALYGVRELEAVLTWADVVVLMKVSSVYEEVWQVLQRRGLLDRAYVVERATWRDRVIYRGLGERPHLKLPYFSVMIVQVATANPTDETISNI